MLRKTWFVQLLPGYSLNSQMFRCIPGSPFIGAILINCLDCVGLVAVGSGFCESTIYGIGLIHRGHCLNHGYTLILFMYAWFYFEYNRLFYGN